jgi:hypothetical protein
MTVKISVLIIIKTLRIQTIGNKPNSKCVSMGTHATHLEVIQRGLKLF